MRWGRPRLWQLWPGAEFKLGVNRDASSKAEEAQPVFGGLSALFPPSATGQNISPVWLVFSLLQRPFQPCTPRSGRDPPQCWGLGQIAEPYLVTTSLSLPPSFPQLRIDSGLKGDTAAGIPIFILLRKVTGIDVAQLPLVGLKRTQLPTHYPRCP